MTNKDLKWEKAKLNDRPTGSLNNKVRISDIKFIPFDEKTEWFYQKIFAFAKEINDKYYNFELHGLTDFLQYGRYLKDGKYEFHIDLVNEIIKNSKINVDLIGFHGQTIWHKPEFGSSRQLGNGKLLSKSTKTNVIYDFRANDLKNRQDSEDLSPASRDYGFPSLSMRCG